MNVENKENQTAENMQSEEITSTENESSEISEPRWSVVTYESVAVSGMTYDEALEWLKKLETKKISGLCIVTDEAAARVQTTSK